MSYPPPGRHPDFGLPPVYVRVSAGKRSFVVFGEGQRRIAECDEDCQFWAWPGTYRVRLTQTEHEPERSVRLRIRYSGNYRLELGDSEARGAGLALGIVGSAIAAVGTVMWVAGSAYYNCNSAAAAGPVAHCDTPSNVYYGLGTFVAGAAVGAAGFVIFGNNGSGFHYFSQPALLPMSARVGLVPLSRGGMGLGATLSF
jgi:hypothetical protein